MKRRRIVELVLGIDPGLSGALALLALNGKVIDVCDMPIEPRATKGNQIDAVKLLQRLQGYKTLWGMPIRAVVESTGARPGLSRVTSYKLGEGAGVVRACLVAAGYRTTFVSPQKWKKAVGFKNIPGQNALRRENDQSIKLAKKKVTGSKKFLTLKKHTGRADAILIAHHAQSIRKST